MLRFTSVVTTIIACLLPTGAICILTTATTMAHKLAYIGGFTALVRHRLMWLTDANTSRVNIFTGYGCVSTPLVRRWLFDPADL